MQRSPCSKPATKAKPLVSVRVALLDQTKPWTEGSGSSPHQHGYAKPVQPRLAHTSQPFCATTAQGSDFPPSALFPSQSACGPHTCPDSVSQVQTGQIRRSASVPAPLPPLALSKRKSSKVKRPQLPWQAGARPIRGLRTAKPPFKTTLAVSCHLL